MKRPLSETLAELAATLVGATQQQLEVTSLDLELPLEVALEVEEGMPRFFGDLPSWRWQTGLEAPRSRMKVRWELEVADGGER